MYNSQDNFYGRTEAFSLIKDFLGIPRRATINKDFFLSFFIESHDGFFLKKPEEEIKRIFDNSGIRELNKQYHEAKQKGDPSAQSISQEILKRVAGAVSVEKKPYFVR
ncbi:MAG: hypothetical protein KBB16_01380 [Candidatus Pacebacteria bacterium]|nr:hypothetical protein [Candidatus Paceibacterota bacterium]